MTDEHGPSASALGETAAAMLEVFDEGVPAVLRGVGPLFDPTEVMSWIMRAHPAARAKTSRDKIIALKQSWGLSPAQPEPDAWPQPGRSAEVYRNGGLVLDPSPFLPTENHATFEQWVAHAREGLGGDFGMQAPCLECASWDAVERLHTLLGPVLATTGPRTYRYNAFLGDYRRTPFGFHVDPHQEAVFQYALHGRRRGLFWEGLTLSEDDDAGWVEDSNGTVKPRREPEVVLDVEPGDLVFWPGTHVHGFESDGPSMALSIVIDRASPRRREEIIAGLEVSTMAGKVALPPMIDRPPFTEADTIERRPGFALAYERYDDALIVGVCGRTFEWPDRNSLAAAMKLFDFLNAQQRVGVAAVADACADEWLEREEVCDVLTMLAGLGWLR